jgi:hypothetical protein
METWVKRLEIEAEDLEKKHKELTLLVESHEFKNMQIPTRRLLVKQKRRMAQYLGIIQEMLEQLANPQDSVILPALVLPDGTFKVNSKILTKKDAWKMLIVDDIEWLKDQGYSVQLVKVIFGIDGEGNGK